MLHRTLGPPVHLPGSLAYKQFRVSLSEDRPQSFQATIVQAFNVADEDEDEDTPLIDAQMTDAASRRRAEWSDYTNVLLLYILSPCR